MTRFAVKRVCDPPEATDGAHILVDRLWPRGISEQEARIDAWLKDIAPSDALRKRFHGKVEGWEAFRDAYFRELREPSARTAADTLMGRAGGGAVTLLYAVRDEQRNNAVVPRDWLQRRLDETTSR